MDEISDILCEWDKCPGNILSPPFAAFPRRGVRCVLCRPFADEGL